MILCAPQVLGRGELALQNHDGLEMYAGGRRVARNRANVHAVDAMKQYNDAVGSLGATCDELRYPPSSGPGPQ